MTLPRDRPAPEYNVIQNPELLRRLQQFLGMRQAHIAPALSEGVQAVVVLGDLRDQRREIGGACIVHGVTTAGDGISLVASASFNNPTGSGVKAILRKAVLTPTGNTGNVLVVKCQTEVENANMALQPAAFQDGMSVNAGVFTPLDPSWPRLRLPACQFRSSRDTIRAATTTLYELPITDIAPIPVYEREFTNLVVYPRQAVLWQGQSVLALSGSFKIGLEWIEEPLSP